MVRGTLPWLRDTKPPRDSSQNRKAPKRRRIDVSTSDRDTDALDEATFDTPTQPTVSETRSGPRSGSPCLPPPPVPDPTVESAERMRAGYGADDAWKMVEDEFLSTAQSFTQHLRKAEYRRLRRRARARQAAGIVEGRVRPVLGAPSVTAERVRNDKGTGDESPKGVPVPDTVRAKVKRDRDETWLGDPRLADLMESPRRPAAILRGSGPGKNRTGAIGTGTEAVTSPRRARTVKVEIARRDVSNSSEAFRRENGIAGTELSGAVSEQESVDSDDLDAAVKSRSHTAKVSENHSRAAKSDTRVDATVNTIDASAPSGTTSQVPVPSLSARPARSDSSTSTRPVQTQFIFSDGDNDDDPRPQSAAMLALMAKRKARRMAVAE